MNDNLEPLKSAVLAYYDKRGLDPHDSPPERDVFHWYAQRTHPELLKDFDRLYYEAHNTWVYAHYRSGAVGWPYEISPEKLAQCEKAYSADSFPRLRGVIQHAGMYWYIASCMWMTEDRTICRAHRIISGVHDLGIEPGACFYAGKTVTYQGMTYTVTTKKAVFFSLQEAEPVPTQEGLFS